jgi:hypothetical protein
MTKSSSSKEVIRRRSSQTALLGITTDGHDDLQRLYVKRKTQCNKALKDVIKQHELVKHSDWFLGTLKTLNSGTDGYFFIDDFIGHVADVNQGDESSLDAAVTKLAVAHNRLHEAIDALNDRMIYPRLSSSSAKKLVGEKLNGDSK